MTSAITVFTGLALLGCGSTAGGVGPGDVPADDLAKGSPSSQALSNEEVVAEALRTNSAAVQTCWAKGAVDNLDVSGVVELSLSVSVTGRTENLKVLRDEPEDRTLTACLSKLWTDHSWPSQMALAEVVLPFSFETPSFQYKVSSEHAIKYVFPGTETTVRLLFDRVNSGNSAAGLTVIAAQPGIHVPLHEHTSTEVLYILSGTGEVYDLRGPEKGSTKVGANTAVYIAAGTAHGMLLRDPKDIAAVQLYAPSGPEQRFKGIPSTATTPVSAKDSRRGFPKPEIRRLRLARTEELSQGARAEVLFESLAKKERDVSVSLLVAEAGAHIEVRSHADESEYLYVTKGSAVMRINGETLTASKGEGIQIPPGIDHDLSVSEQSEFQAIRFLVRSSK